MGGQRGRPPAFRKGDYEGAKTKLEQAHAEFPEQGAILYNLACAEARLGNSEAALEHLVRAVELEPRLLELTQTDEDLESIRDDTSFPAAATA